MKRIFAFGCVFGLAILAGGKLLADDASTIALDTRYGWFNGLDHRSSYGQGAYAEPFLETS